MSLLSRLKQEKHKFRFLSHQIKTHYFSDYYHHTCSRTLIPLPHHPILDSHKFGCNVRFYAAPAQFLKPKKEEEEKEVGHRLNEQIKAQTVRLIEGREHCVISRYEALKRAKDAGMDLVEVDANGKPPACKIYDYKMDLFLRKKREKENKQKRRSKGLKTGPAKEVRFAGKISKHDLQMKADTVKRLLEKGHRIKCTAIEPTDDMDLKTLVSRFSALIEDVALQESEPQVEKKQAFVFVRHVKFGGPRSGRKKASKASTETKDTSDSEELTDEDVETKESESVVSGEKEDSDTVFAAEDNERTKNTERVVEFEQDNTGPSSAPKQGMVNRYATVHQPNVNERSTFNRPNNVPQMPRTPQSNMNPTPQHPYQRNQPHFNPNASSQMRQTPRAEVPPPTLPYQRNQPHFNPNASSQMRQTPRAEVPPPTLPYQRNQPHFNPNASSQMSQTPRAEVPPPSLPYQRNQPQPNTNASSPNIRQLPRDGAPAFGVQRKDTSSSGNSGSPTKTFGIFSPKPKDTSGQSAPGVTNRYQKANPPGPERSPGTQSSGQSAPAVTNRYQRASPPSPERSPGTQSSGQGGAPAVTNRYQRGSPPGPGTAGPTINRGPGFNSTEQRRQGGFSADDSNAYPNRNREQADYRKR